MPRENNSYLLPKKARKWTKLSVVMLGLAVMSVLSACATRPHKVSVVCRIHFDNQDEGLSCLNEQNLRALLSFTEICP